MKQLVHHLILGLIFSAPAFAEPEAAALPAVTEVPAAQPIAEPSAAAAANPADLVILKEPDKQPGYLLSPGDALDITVWKEEGLQKEQFLISPDGTIVFPLIGSITAAGRSISDLKELITHKLADYIADPSVTIKLLNNQGNAVFVIGKVNKPGQVFSGRRIDVLQALSLAGGLTVFAKDSNISIQRRVGNEIKVFQFDYASVIDGDSLDQNILLEAGDTITVP